MLDWLSVLEGPALLWIQETLRGPLDALFIFYTHLGDAGMVWIALSVLMLLWKPTRGAGVLSLLALFLGLLVTNLTIKPLVSRTRPWLDVAGLVPLVEEGDPNSFPSGHTCAAFAACVAWAGSLPRKTLRAAVLLPAVVMGLSRLYVGVHYPSDVLVGALVGTMCAAAALWIGRRTLDRDRIPSGG